MLCTKWLMSLFAVRYSLSLSKTEVKKKKKKMYELITRRRKNKTPSVCFWCCSECFHIKPTLVPVFVLPDLWDDLQHGAVLRDPQQPGVLKRQTSGPLAMKEGRARSPRLILFLSFYKQEPSRILLAGFSQLRQRKPSSIWAFEPHCRWIFVSHRCC